MIDHNSAKELAEQVVSPSGLYVDSERNLASAYLDLRRFVKDALAASQQYNNAQRSGDLTAAAARLSQAESALRAAIGDD